MSGKALLFAKRTLAFAVLSLIFATVAGVLTGCEKHAVESQRVNLPGFSIELPPGAVITTSTDPTAGKHSVELAAPSWSDIFHVTERADRELEVHWSTNPMAREIWSSKLMPALAPKLPSAGSNAKVLEERAVAADRWLYVVGTESAPVGVGVVNCDPRFAVIVTYVRFTDRARQAESLSRILNSVHCAVTDANRDRPVAATRLPAKFGGVANPAAQTYQSLDGEYLAITVGSSNLQRNPEMLREVIEPVASAIIGAKIEGWQYVQNSTPEHNVSILRATIQESGKKIYFGVLNCAPTNLNLMVIWLGPDPSDDLARERISQVGCPGEASTTPPDFATLAKSACASSDQAACAPLATLP